MQVMTNAPAPATALWSAGHPYGYSFWSSPGGRWQPGPKLRQGGLEYCGSSTFFRSSILSRIPPRPFEWAGMSASASQVIGRSKEFDSLTLFLDAVVEGPAAFLIEGEAGIGKTALWKQAVDLALRRSYRVLACRPADSETRLSFKEASLVPMTDLTCPGSMA